MYKVRFHLGAGQHYMHWQVKKENTIEIEYYDPERVSLHLHSCVLKNNRKTAERIFLGENKTVCAWVMCEKVTVHETNSLSVPSWYSELRYNPRIKPYWHFNNDAMCLDNMVFYNILTKNNLLYVGRLEEGYLRAI